MDLNERYPGNYLMSHIHSWEHQYSFHQSADFQINHFPIINPSLLIRPARRFQIANFGKICQCFLANVLGRDLKCLFVFQGLSSWRACVALSFGIILEHHFPVGDTPWSIPSCC